MKDIEKQEDIKWFWKVFILAFFLSIGFSFISNNAVTTLSIIPAIIILLVVILVGIVFDIIGVAVTVADVDEFNAMATKKIPGAKSSIKLIKNASRVSNICADVIGDICGVLSGSMSSIIALKILGAFNVSTSIQFIIGALVASLTIGGKALGKGFAKRNSTKIIKYVGVIYSKFRKE